MERDEILEKIRENCTMFEMRGNTHVWPYMTKRFHDYPKMIENIHVGLGMRGITHAWLEMTMRSHIQSRRVEESHVWARKIEMTRLRRIKLQETQL